MGSGELWVGWRWCSGQAGAAAAGTEGALPPFFSSWSWRAHLWLTQGPLWLVVSPSSKANVSTLSNSFVGWTRMTGCSHMPWEQGFVGQGLQ